MQTYSHLLIAAAISIPLKQRAAVNLSAIPPFNTKAFLFGSILPDLALILITLVCLARDKFFNVFNSPSWNQHDSYSKASPELLDISWTASLFDDWFFNNPMVIILQNTFHSPLLLIILISISYILWKRKKTQHRLAWGFWICCAALLHTVADIPLHHDDGPLIFFPLDWSYRYSAPFSYWDSNHHGFGWSIFEYSVDFIIIIFLFWHANIRHRVGKNL